MREVNNRRYERKYTCNGLSGKTLLATVTNHFDRAVQSGFAGVLLGRIHNGNIEKRVERILLFPDTRRPNVDPGMNILLKSLPEIEAHFGKKATIASNLLDMVGQGEKAHGFLTGTMDNGWDVTVGLFNDKARYARFKKRTATKWTEADLRTVLMQIGLYSNWSRSPADSDYFDYAEKQGDNVVASATGWQTPGGTRAFIYVPAMPGEIGIMPDKTAIDQKS
jgi:hypothetical protein